MATKNVRALTPAEAERVRDRVRDLIEELGSEKAVEAYLRQRGGRGMGQQYVGRIKSSFSTPSYYAASVIADADRVPVKVLLAGVPRNLYRAIMARRWHPGVSDAVGLTFTDRGENGSVEDWTTVLRDAEEFLVKLARRGLKHERRTSTK